MQDDGHNVIDWDSILDRSPYLDHADAIRLIDHLAEQGASDEELVEATRTGTLGPLALDLALRGRGEHLPFDEAARRAGLEVEEAARVWRALGFSDPLDPPQKVTPAQVEALRKLTRMGQALLGADAEHQLARVIGSGMARLAEALVDTFRVQAEMPRIDSGEPSSEVVEHYSRAAAVMIPALAEVLGEVLTEHLLAASRASWTPDEQRAAVTRSLAVGFADLVEYTRTARGLTPAELAGAVGRFESLAGEISSRHRGRVVKLIGDEVMFVAGDPADGARVALELIDELGRDPSMPQLRVGLASGPVISQQGDYYGDVVNLAARLVKAAEPGTVLASESVAKGVTEPVAAEPVELPPLKGFDEAVPVYRLTGTGY